MKAAAMCLALMILAAAALGCAPTAAAPTAVSPVAAGGASVTPAPTTESTPAGAPPSATGAPQPLTPTSAPIQTVALPTGAAPTATRVPSTTPMVVPGASLSLADPAQGLAALPAYAASYTLTFSGTRAGKASIWSQAYTLTVASASQARLLAYNEYGLGPRRAAYPSLEGVAGKSRYSRMNPGDPCVASDVVTGTVPPALLDPSGLLPRGRILVRDGVTETVNGIAVLPYRVNPATGAVTAPGPAPRIWLATQGGYVVRYSAAASGGSEMYGADIRGVLSVEYAVRTIDPSLAAVVPVDCPLPLPDLPAMADRAVVLDYPGLLRYSTGSGIQAVADFYLARLPAAGFSLVGDARIGTINASLTFSRADQTIGVLVESGPPTMVLVTGQGRPLSVGPLPTPTVKPVVTPGAAATAFSASSQMRIINSVGLLTGQNPNQSVFPSYHLTSTNALFLWDSDREAIARTDTQIAVDVQGKNVHAISRSAAVGKPPEVSEFYIIGDQNYDVQAGKVISGWGLSSISWLMWPLDPMMLLTLGSYKASPAGAESLDGRVAEVYDIAGKASDDLTGMFTAAGLPYVSVSGRVWVDKATGGLLKAMVDYEENVRDMDRVIKGTVKGRLELAVTRIGAVTVQLPN